MHIIILNAQLILGENRRIDDIAKEIQHEVVNPLLSAVQEYIDDRRLPLSDGISASIDHSEASEVLIQEYLVSFPSVSQSHTVFGCIERRRIERSITPEQMKELRGVVATLLTNAAHRFRADCSIITFEARPGARHPRLSLMPKHAGT